MDAGQHWWRVEHLNRFGLPSGCLPNWTSLPAGSETTYKRDSPQVIRRRAPLKSWCGYSAPRITQRCANLTKSRSRFAQIVGIIRMFALYNHKALALRGTPGQLALAEWLFTELASGARAPGPAQESGLPASKEYWDPEPVGKLGELVRVFHFAPSATDRNIQEAAHSVRTVGRIFTVFPCTALRAVVVRGNAQEVALAEALIRERSFVPANAVR